jgi:AcrR family transcriptional regulator
MTAAAPSGRRRTRNPELTRAAIVDALLDALGAGERAPTAKSLAARAGVSERSVFVHFADLDDLRAAASERQHGRIVERLTAVDASLPLRDRVVAIATQREQIHPLQSVRVIALVESRSSAPMAVQMKRTDAALSQQVLDALAPELAADPELAKVVDALFSWGFRTQLTDILGLSGPEATAATVRTVLSVLQ